MMPIIARTLLVFFNERAHIIAPVIAIGKESNIKTGTCNQEKNKPTMLIPKPANAIKSPLAKQSVQPYPYFKK